MSKKIVVCLLAVFILSGCQQDLKSFTDAEAIAFENKLKSNVVEITNLGLDKEQKSIFIKLIEEGDIVLNIRYEMSEGILDGTGRYFIASENLDEIYVYKAVDYINIREYKLDDISRGIGYSSDVYTDESSELCTISEDFEAKDKSEDNCSNEQKRVIDETLATKDAIYTELGISDDDFWKYLEWCVKNNVDEFAPKNEDSK